jgi:hypothetical protein
MSDLNLALCLPVPEIKALDRGRIISAFPPRQLDQGEVFALYPTALAEDALPIEKYYRASFRPIARLCLDSYNSEEVIIKNWARCEFCQILEVSDALEALPCSEVWTRDYLQHRFSLHPYLFLAHLRVYEIAEPLQLSTQGKVGKFIGLPQPISTDNSTPVLTDRVFTQRHHQLKNLEPPPHPELEELQSLVAQMALTNPDAKALDRDIRTFLGWSSDVIPNNHNSNLDWIRQIAEVGNSSNGNEFEKLVRRSFIQLGFTNSNTNSKASLDPDATGGAGGLDFYCEKPYLVVGECKATKTETVPDSTPAQLVKLGYKILQTDIYDACIKVIMAAGRLTTQANETAIGTQMNVMRPETLQKLVELNVNYPGAINLLDLKKCWEQKPFGEDADKKVNSWIDKVKQSIELRSILIQLIKQTNREVGIDYLSGAYEISNPSQKISTNEMHELLIELSSPLTGYLGREKGGDWKSDRFYFLRDLAT